MEVLGQSLDTSPFEWGADFVLLQGLTLEMELCPGTCTYFSLGCLHGVGTHYWHTCLSHANVKLLSM